MTQNLRNRLGKMVTITWEDGKTARVRSKWYRGHPNDWHNLEYLYVSFAQVERAADRTGATGCFRLDTVYGYRDWDSGVRDGYFYADKIQE